MTLAASHFFTICIDQCLFAATPAVLSKERLHHLPLMHTTISPWPPLLWVSRGGLVPIQIALATTAMFSPLVLTDQTSHSSTVAW